MSLFSKDIRGMLRVALCLRLGSSMTLYRQAIELQVEKRLQLCSGEPAPGAVQYRNYMLDLLSTQSTNPKKP